jgi:DNA-binding response OmpR family regulator
MLRICLIDDDKLVRGAATLGLEDAGYSVFPAADATSGLDLIERERPDLVITDLGLPDMDGEALIKLIRARFPGLPIIAMSGQDFAALGTASSPVAYGADVSLQKPFKMHQAEAAIAKALETRGIPGV